MLKAIFGGGGFAGVDLSKIFRSLKGKLPTVEERLDAPVEKKEKIKKEKPAVQVVQTGGNKQVKSLLVGTAKPLTLGQRHLLKKS